MSNNRNDNHRKIYAEYYGIEIPDSMDIHHIDEDRDNNDISNLLMLPKDLHQRYHEWKREFDRVQMAPAFDGLLLGRNQYNFTVMAVFGVICQECLAFINLQAQLDARKSLGCEHG